jgi:hypothetical protein
MTYMNVYVNIQKLHNLIYAKIYHDNCMNLI